MVTPFGKYADILTTIVALGVIVAAITLHLFNVSFLHNDDAFIDNLAWLAAGAMFGTRAAANGYAGQVVAAHKRLDLIGAPPAKTGDPTIPLTASQTPPAQ